MTLASPRVVPRYEALSESAGEYEGMDGDAIRLVVEILAFADTLEKHYDANLAAHGLSQGRLYALLNVATALGEGIAPADLAEILNVSRATVTGLIAGLERERLVRSLQRSDDRRRWTVRVTREGIGKLEAMLPEHCRAIAAGMRALDNDEKRRLVGLLDKLSTSISAFYGKESPAA